MTELFEYRGDLYPDYLRRGNAQQFIQTVALQFCHGRGVDVGAGKWPLPGAEPIELSNGETAYELPGAEYDFVFSSHCLEHLSNPIEALEHWRDRLRRGGTLFLYLPHYEQKYWRPQNCRKHLHAWLPAQMVEILRDLGFVRILNSERDMAWSFACVGFKP